MRIKRWAAVSVLMAGAWATVGPSAAREFGDHERPWARDVASSAAAIPAECPAAAAQLGLATVQDGLSPELARPMASGERALALAAARNARLDVRQARIAEAQATLDRTAHDVRAQIQALHRLRASVELEIERLEQTEDAAELRRVDLLRAVRPRQAAVMIGEASIAEQARLLGALQPREAAAILGEMNEADAQAVFTAMRAGVVEGQGEDAFSGSDASGATVERG